jgi:hypothetical protein
MLFPESLYKSKTVTENISQKPDCKLFILLIAKLHFLCQILKDISTNREFQIRKFKFKCY